MIFGNLSHSIFSVALAEQELKGYIAEGSEIEDCLVMCNDESAAQPLL